MSKIIVDSCVFINAFNLKSDFREECIDFLQNLINNKKLLTMPAHGWFEVLCSLRRIERNDKAFCGPLINGIMQYPVELIHIDSDFINNYGNVDIPYLKAGDHIYTVIAYKNKYSLITTDNAMIKVANILKMSVYTPKEYLSITDGGTK